MKCFVFYRPMDGVDYMISLPAHGAVVGAWLGAWPMPLDWERPWQVIVPLLFIVIRRVYQLHVIYFLSPVGFCYLTYSNPKLSFII